MDVIGVIDLSAGVAVHAVRGERERYRPVQSVLAPAGDAVALARAYHEALSCPAVYVADLDAIRGRGDHAGLIARIAREVGAPLWVDAGAGDPEGAARVLGWGARRVIIGAETVREIGALPAVVERLGQEQVLFSVDMRGGRVIWGRPGAGPTDPLPLVDLLVRSGYADVILLDLDRVGSGMGPDLPLLSRLQAAHPDVRLYQGGGVRDLEDLRALAEIGVAGALVATALHQGALGAAELRQVGVRGHHAEKTSS